MPVTSNRTLFFPDPCSYDTSPPGCHCHPSEQNFSSREAGRETAMAKDILGEAGLHFDELNKLRVLDPEVTQQTIELKEECKDFVDKIGQFQKIVGGLIELVDQLAKEAENEKMKAIGARNLLKSIAKQREAQQQQLQALIAEKKMQLERYRVEYEALCKVEAEQNEFIDQFIFQK
ncbi:PREDICTED: LOW QUALITY PROTEIN: intraflagellar transport protein 20 homolog [Ceratotherium simum simum]|uniref:LOW QUALITY PROTEIN: intraflagellar transport protein 20 homolog n=1 Tax=Ceratotherium simum simum TaxID=73337 RepID=A0ABM0HT72_CERSS|nr:PREDICTED: LOW QUALITY PROTEIN: intraflagellar transport protein 20 homolog [Ceratotherium simum simum]